MQMIKNEFGVAAASGPQKQNVEECAGDSACLFFLKNMS